MAPVGITPIELTANTRSADLVGAGTAITDAAANTFVITPPAGAAQLLLFFEADGSCDTVSISAGDNPPSMLAGLGATSIVLAASDLRMVILEPGQHVQNDGTITATCSDDGTRCYALFMPGYLNGGSAVAGA